MYNEPSQVLCFTPLEEFIGIRRGSRWSYKRVELVISDEASKKQPFPCPCTYRTALSHYLDITSVPRTHILRELAEYAAEDKDKEFLLQITSPTPEGKVSNSEHHRSLILFFFST